MNLFNQKILLQRISRFDFPTGNEEEEYKKIIANWQYALKDRDLSKTKEKSVQGQFLIKFFGEILKYSTQTDNKDEWNLIQHPTTEVDSQEADGSLGFFTKDNKITKVVIELKDAKTSLDKKQTGREKGYTPIEQAYLYSTKFDKCNWIIVSNFREIRLYNKNRTQDYFEKFDVLELHKELEFKRFIYILCKTNLISKSHTSVIDDLANDSSTVNEDITKKFYGEYKNARLNIFLHLIEHNPTVEQTILLEKAQKIIDRFIFILFCEDTGNLLPRNLVKDTYELGIHSRDRSDERVWREFKNLFMDIDAGRSDIDPKINKYNGGLFAEDTTLNSLSIKDSVWKILVNLNNYDFESELGVNILGHIFEQSISDLETLKTTIPLTTENQQILTTEAGDKLLLEQEEVNIVEKKGRRKKEGIFYTPDFITHFLVEEVIGRYLDNSPDRLETIKILDPACGSGAFLNQAHTYLMNEYKVRYEQRLVEQANKRQLDFSDINLAETNRSILLNNLYGVDLNPESVEITKLSLWLKTARSSEPLQNLDKNIKCGNSIVDDTEYAGVRAFEWKKEFSEIFNDGGFDVIVGNPPYVRQEIIKDIKPYLENNYKVYTGVSDLYVYFFEKALELLKENGFFGFIVSSKFLRADYGKKLTQYLQQNFTVLELIDFGDLQIFEGATTYPCIIIIQKKKPSDSQQINFLKLNSLEAISDLGMALKKEGQTIEINNNSEQWQLKNNAEILILDKIQKNAVKLGKYINNQIFYGIKTGFNDAFIITTEEKERLIKEDSKSSEVIKPILIGKDINKYNATWKRLWCIVIPSGWTNKNKGQEQPEDYFSSQYQCIYKHLKTVQSEFINKNVNGSARRKGLFDRDDQGDYWWELRPCVYYKFFDDPKIIWGNLATKASFSYDYNNFYISAPACFIPTEEKWLTAILNSSVTNFFLKNNAIERQGGFFEQKPMYVSEVPIPTIPIDIKNKLTLNVDNLLLLHKEKNQILEQAFEVLKSEYAIRKFTHKLQNFLDLGWNEFIEELEKQHTLFSLQQKDELNKWFRNKQSDWQNKNNEINNLEMEINNFIYKLYGLTKDEINIVNSYS